MYSEASPKLKEGIKIMIEFYLLNNVEPLVLLFCHDYELKYLEYDVDYWKDV